MMRRGSIFLSVIVILVLNLQLNRAEEISCIYEDKESRLKYDLTPLTNKQGDYSVITRKKRFYFNICKNISRKCKGNDKDNIAAISIGNDDDDGECDVLGDTDSAEFYPNENGIVLQYKHQNDERFILYLKCVQKSKNKEPVLVLDEGDNTIIEWETYRGCDSKGGSYRWTYDTGTIIFFIILIGIIGYLFGGIMYRRSQGYVGIEQFPNIEFWRSVLSRIKNFVTGSRFGRYSSIHDSHVVLVGGQES